MPSNIPPPEEPKPDEFQLLTPEKVKQPANYVLLYDQPIEPEYFVAANTDRDDIDCYKDIDPDDYECKKYGEKAEKQGRLGTYGLLDAFGPHTEGHNILFADGHTKWFKEWSDSSMSRKPN
jgi:prepilin-type processing-associated H-X9-DG protein